MAFSAPSLAALLERSAERFPASLAVSDCYGNELTYRELNEKAARLAGYLAANGVEKGSRVGILLPKSVYSVTAIFAIQKIGAVHVPVDWASPAARAHSIFADCGVSAVIADPRATDSVRELSTAVIVFVGEPGWTAAMAADPLPDGAVNHAVDDLAYILYTSGSTGLPKGVMLSQRNALSFIDWCSSVFDVSEKDRFSSHAPFHFDLSVLDIYVAIKHGASLYLISEDLGKNPKALARYVADNRLSVWYSTPSTLTLLGDLGGLDRLDCTALRYVLFAGEVFPVKHLRRITELWPGAAYFNLYGPTETNVCTFTAVPLPVPEDRTEPYPIGPACSHCVPLVLDTSGRPAVAGDEGLLYVSGDSVFQGYWNRPKENAAAFLDCDGVRWYNTGDVVREEPGQGFTYLGRRDRMVKRRGYRIELDEIQSALYRHTAIREAAVVAIPDNQSGVKIAAFLAAAEGRRPSIIEMKSYCAENLLSYMNPDLFYFRDELPKTSTGKTDFQKLVQSCSAQRQD